jgi:CBS domain containing-hemolysin-like protein
VVLRLLVITPLARLIAPTQRPGELSAQELGRLLELSAQRGVIHPEEEDVLQSVLELGKLRVRDIMTPRVDLVAFGLHRPVGELFALIRATGRSHIPVYDGDVDNVRGMVEARQVLLRRPVDARQLQHLVRQVAFVPELQRADRLLIDFRKRGHNLAIAVDEYGGTAGLVTIEDVAEQMVGDMPGQAMHERGPDIEKMPDGSFRAAAGLALQDWYESFGVSRPTLDAVTLGGLVMTRLGRLPRVGDVVREGNLLLEVEAMDRRRIDTLRVRLAEVDREPSTRQEKPS